MGSVLAMKIEVVRGAVVALKDRQILPLQVCVGRLSGMECEKKRIVRVIRIEDEHGTQIENIVAGDRREISAEKVIFLFVKLRVVNVEGFIEFSAGALDFRQVLVVNHH